MRGPSPSSTSVQTGMERTLWRIELITDLTVLLHQLLPSATISSRGWLLWVVLSKTESGRATWDTRQKSDTIVVLAKAELKNAPALKIRILEGRNGEPERSRERLSSNRVRTT